jgi:hypothetical protein
LRRVATTLATLAAAGLLTLAVPGSASAAFGILWINGKPNHDPTGCFNLDKASSVKNETDRDARIHLEPDCRGKALPAPAVIHSGSTGHLPPGFSIAIH